MKIKIISDGEPMGTKVVDIETGKELENITNIEWHIGCGDIGRATINFIDIPIEVEGEFNEKEANEDNS